MRQLLPRRTRRAFTAVEAVVALMVLTILAAMIWMAFASGGADPAVRDAPAPGLEHDTGDDQIPVMIGGNIFWM